MLTKSGALCGLLMLHYALFIHAMPSPEDYVKPGRKWLTFKNIPEGKVVQVDTMQDFRDFMQQRGKLTVMLFYDDRTAHSKQIFPLWEGLAITLNGVAKVCAMSVSYPFGSTMANLYGVKTVPSVHIISSPTEDDPKYRTSWHTLGGHVEEFTEGLSIEGINKAVMKLLKDDCIAFPQTEEEFATLQRTLSKRSGKYAVVLLTRKKQTTDLFKTLSYKFASDFAFLQIPYSTDLSPVLMEKFKLSKPSDWSPLLFLWDFTSEQPVILYDGKKFDVSAISEFLDQYVSDPVDVQRARSESVQELIDIVNDRCQVAPFVDEDQLQHLLLNSKDDFIVALVPDEGQGAKLHAIQAMACAYTTTASVKKVVWMRADTADRTKTLFGVSTNEALIGVSPARSVYFLSEISITPEDSIRFGKIPLSEPVAFEPSKL